MEAGFVLEETGRSAPAGPRRPQGAPTPAGPSLTCRDTCQGQEPGTASSPLTILWLKFSAGLMAGTPQPGDWVDEDLLPTPQPTSPHPPSRYPQLCTPEESKSRGLITIPFTLSSFWAPAHFQSFPPTSPQLLSTLHFANLLPTVSQSHLHPSAQPLLFLTPRIISWPLPTPCSMQLEGSSSTTIQPLLLSFLSLL